MIVLNIIPYTNIIPNEFSNCKKGDMNMQYSKRRPYRVAKREIEKTTNDTTSEQCCIAKDNKSKIMIAILILVAFLQGVMIGHIIANRD